MEKDNLYNFISLKLSAHKTPVFKEEKQKDWVIYGAEKGEYYNNYPAYLTYLYNRSSKQNAFINGKVHYICGNGIGFDATGLTVGSWTSIDIPLDAGLATQKNNLGALILAGGPDFILDNIYFYKE